MKPPSPSSLIDNLLFSQFSDPNSTEIQSLATDFAILDIQWTPHSELVGGDLLAVATSTGILAFYRLQQQQEQHKLVLSHVQHITDDDTTLVLSLTWHPVRPGVLGLTLSDGRVCMCTSMGTSSGSGSGSTEEDDTAAGLWSQDAAVSLQDVHEHELEAWMMTFTPESLNVLSGGDDMVLQCSHVAEDDDDDDDDDDESEAEEEEQKEDQVEDEQHIQKTNKNKTNLLWQNRKLHHAGITAILPLSETLVITGSYDDHIRLLQLPKIPGDTRPKLLAELNLGGGVWRLKLLTTGRASSSSSSQRDDDDSADAAENKSSSDSTVSALRRSSSCSSSSITRYALPSFCRCCCCYSTSTSTCPIHILFLSEFKNKKYFLCPCQLHRACVSQSVSQSACLDCSCRDATRFLF